MKINIFGMAIICLLITACGGSDSGGGTAPTLPAPTPEPSDPENPPVAYNAVDSLKAHAEFPIGMEVSAADQERSIFTLTSQQSVLTYHFNELVAGLIMKMSYLHPQQDTFYFDDADALVDYALANNMRMHGHTTIWYWDSQIPEWIKSFEGDWNSMMHNHVYQIVNHFAGRVNSWDVVNEAVDYNWQTAQAGYRNDLFYQNMGASFIENAYVSAREGDPQAELYYNDFHLSYNNGKLDFIIAMLNDFIDRDIPIDGLGFQMHITMESPSREQMDAAFQKAAATGLKIKISELDIAINQRGPDYTGGVWYPEQVLTIALARQQKQRYKDVVASYLENVPPDQRGGITVWGLVDEETWMRAVANSDWEWPLLFNDDYTVKPAFYGFLEALTGQ